MKKLLSCILLAVMLLPAAAASNQGTQTPRTHTITTTLTFHDPIIGTADDYSTITIDNTNSWLSTPGAPSLPSELQTYTFPLGTTITSITVTFTPSHDYSLSSSLRLTSPPQTVIGEGLTSAQTPSISLTSYPDPQWSYHLGAGLSTQNQHTLFCSVRCTPVQYHESSQSISFSSAATITITYVDPASNPFPLSDTYELVIIAPQEFSASLKPLVDQRMNHGNTTLLVDKHSICNDTNYSSGRDCAEKLKFFIKDCIENYGTTSVLFVGGRNGGIMKEKWWMPVRYSHLDDESDFEYSYVSDLYFADIYTANLSFSSWDTDHNGVFAEWTNTSKDILDMYPDVNFGRLACTSVGEIQTVVNKIIRYENETHGADWFKTMVVVGGDSAPGYDTYEGECENQAALDFMPGYTPVKLWTSLGTLTGSKDVINAVNAGCGFLYFDGHGNPQLWSTHPPDNNSWVDGLNTNQMRKLTNAEKLPIVVCGGCHNGQFNVSLGNLFKGIIQERLQYFRMHFYYSDWIPECWAWKIISTPKGGGVATLANTALDWFSEGDYNNDTIPDAVQFYSGYMNTHVFYNIGTLNMTYLGQAYTQALIEYLNAFPPMDDKLDCKTVQEYTLFGDPLLAIGGYE
jgi:hypothetical protein